MAKIIGIYNQKGGTGKTSAAINIAAFLEKEGANVLAVDTDIQGNFTDAMLAESGSFDRTDNTMNYLVNLLIDSDLQVQDVSQPVSFKLKAKNKPKRVNIDLIPASIDENVKLYNSPFLLKSKLDEVKDKYDYIIIDFPPERPYADFKNESFNIVTLALCCANEILTPCTTDADSLSGFATLTEHIAIIKKEMNPNLYKTSFFINGFNGYKAEKDFLDFCNSIESYSGICIPYSGIFKSSRMIDRPMAWFNNGSNVALAYKNLTEYIK